MVSPTETTGKPESIPLVSPQNDEGYNYETSVPNDDGGELEWGLGYAYPPREIKLGSPRSRTQNQAMFALTSRFLWTSLAVALLSFLNIALLPFTLPAYAAIPLSQHALKHLPHPTQHLGLDRAKAVLEKLGGPKYHFSWPEMITRLNEKLKGAVYGSGVDVFISVENTALMRFPIPPHGSSSCALAWTPPPQDSARGFDLETRGDVSEVEVWSIISPNPIFASIPALSSSADIDFDDVSWSTRPIRGELLGTLDIRRMARTVEFECPSDADMMVVELRCLRVDCHVRFKQVHMVPKIGFELLRRSA
jgi:hypothetical protein